MRKLKSILSLLLAGALLMGTLTVLGACHSGGTDETSDTKTTESDSNIAADLDLDGTWLELNAIGNVLVISGNDIVAYQHDDDGVYQEGKQFTLVNGKYTQTGELSISEDVSAPYTATTAYSIKNGLLVETALVSFEDPSIAEMFGDETFVSEYARIDTPVSELRRINLSEDESWHTVEEGAWLTEDNQYTFRIDYKDDFVGSSRLYDLDEQFSDHFAHIVDSFLYVYSNGNMVWLFPLDKDDNDDMGVLLHYTMEGDRLTISGLDKTIMKSNSYSDSSLFPDSTYEPFPHSELTFLYQAAE